MNYDKRLEDLFIELPEVASVSGAVVTDCLVGKLLFVGGQLPMTGGKMEYKGRVGIEITLEKGALAARLALLRVLSLLKQRLGSLNKIQRIIQMNGFVACGGSFSDVDRVFDGASNLLKEIFGPHGQHTRNAVGVATLPKEASISLSLIVEVK